MGYCCCDSCIYLRIHVCTHTLRGAILLQELEDSNNEQERSDLNLHQMSNRMQLVLGEMDDSHQPSSKSWIHSVPLECVSPANQQLVEGFILRLNDWSRGTSGAHSLLCMFWTDTKYRKSVPTESMYQWADHCRSQALLAHPRSHHHTT